MRILIFTIITLLICANNCNSQNNSPNGSIEQNALNYFVEKINGTPIYYDGFRKFDIDSGLIYIIPHTATSKNVGLSLNSFKYSRKSNFLVLHDSTDYLKVINCDTQTYRLNINHLRVKDYSNLNLEEIRKPNDISIVLTSRYYYNNYYYIRIFIYVKLDWKSYEAIIKLDSNGIPIDIIFEYGDI
ncbi:MAG: hypothetical protein NTZ33_06655 [Bacteroidetes bacterium]|nr:hypothetical protein [Bacteroidota bacterium]